MKEKILVIDDDPGVRQVLSESLAGMGYRVHAAESGEKALGTIRETGCDLVILDMVLPRMDGMEVLQEVQRHHPELCVIMITGYGTVETAVETMQLGAVDYVQKPFTEEELVEFARKLLIKREARLESQRRPTVRVVAPSTAETAAAHEFCVPGGAFVSDGHSWARIEPTGQVRVGLDDFARKALRAVKGVEPPQLGETIQRGEPLFIVTHEERKLAFAAPLSGRVVRTNETLALEPNRVIQSPYDRGWVCLIQPLDLAGELSSLRIGKPVIEWYQEEVARLKEFGKAAPEGMKAEDWDAFEKKFLKHHLAKPA